MSAKLGTAGNSLLVEPVSKLSPGLTLRDAKKALAYKVVSQAEDKAEIQLLIQLLMGWSQIRRPDK